ncbi:hypothetical protein NIES4072_05220 [Nostoc commune NIES-4072]|uniref:Uncharacterized protein n=1 Tax=Nostoc commune NIES-4072 TaxID=2005467 RepID=A0A2R5FEL5_NOSCO|nr:hypothetical protein [Nostoc commune]BBD65799.1 hypothetical protein NIES4070_21600 [Nostoc commune HK-02]GBG16876.1 hypothetical protein NIES4072_05220 [Nostoc commune NIES-4072]
MPNNGEQIFNGQVERELLDGVPWLLGQQPQLPDHLQLLLNEQQQTRDIWELPKENSPSSEPTKMHFHSRAISFLTAAISYKSILHVFKLY